MSVRKFFSSFSKLYFVQLIVWPSCRVFRLFQCGELAMYLVGGVAICGGLGIVFSLFSDSFNLVGEHVLSAMIVFVPSVVGTSFFDLIFLLCRKKNPIPTYMALWLIVLALVLLGFTTMAYFTEGHRPKLTYWVWGLSLAYWTIVNADDTKFSPRVNPDNIEGGDAMRLMSGQDTLSGVKA